MTQAKVGWRAYVVTQVVNAVDADAQAFIAAAGITNLTQASAINTLVNDLKTYGLWTKMKALYPMVGGSATSHKFNLKDPRDLDAAYRLVFNGGWTHTSNGALPNGTTGYADTKLKPFGVFNNTTYAHISYYSRTSSGLNNSEYGMGVADGISSLCFVLRRLNNTQAFFSTFSNATYQWVFNTTSTDGSGLFVGNQQGTNIKLLKQNILQGSNTQLGSTTPPNLNVFIGALNDNGLSGNYTNKESAFASIGDGLSDTEAANFYTSVQKFQTTLGRQIGTPIVSDTDAQAFINAAGLTDLGQASAINTLVTDLKTANIWTKMKALYPFVGGTATSHKFNLKDPRDLNAAFRLVFTGGWTHTSTGALPNGTTGYADTKLVPSTVQTLNSNGMGMYLGTVNTSTSSDPIHMGVFNTVTQASTLWVNKTNNIIFGRFNGGATTSSTITNIGLGLISGHRTSSTSTILYKNSTNIGSSVPTGGLPTVQICLGNISTGPGTSISMYPSGWTNSEQRLSYISDGLNSTDITNLYTAVQKYQTTLGRQIGTPVLADGQTAGLLDTYSGAAAAYSLRKLRNGYVGNAIRVRRSSDNTEQDIAFDASGGLDTVSLLAFVGGGNGFVTTWYDQSGNGKHAVQTTAANQPFIVNTGVVNTYNSKPCVKFDGNGDYIESPYNTGTSNEIYFVTQTTDTQFLFPRGITGYGFVADQGSATSTGISLYTTTQPQLYVNSVLSPTANRGAVYNLLVGYKLSLHKGANITGFSYLRFGMFTTPSTALDFNGNLFEWIIYPTLQSSQTSIESNINSYYTIY